MDFLNQYIGFQIFTGISAMFTLARRRWYPMSGISGLDKKIFINTNIGEGFE